MMDKQEIEDRSTDLVLVMKDLLDASRFLLYAVAVSGISLERTEWLERAKRYISKSVDDLTGIAMRIG